MRPGKQSVEVSTLGLPALDEPSVYPGPTPEHSYLLVGNQIFGLEPRPGGLGGWEASDRPGVTLDGLLARCSATPTVSRSAVLAFGSNASPPQLARKFAGVPGSAIPVVRGTVFGLRLAFSAHINRLGYIPAAVRSAGSGVRLPVWVTFLDGDQLGVMDPTEPSYDRVVLSNGDGRPVVELESGEQLAKVALYRTKWGVLDLEACDELGLISQLALRALLEAQYAAAASLFGKSGPGTGPTVLAEIPGFTELGLVVADGLEDRVGPGDAVYGRSRL
jgi:hypothetical protein